MSYMDENWCDGREAARTHRTWTSAAGHSSQTGEALPAAPAKSRAEIIAANDRAQQARLVAKKDEDAQAAARETARLAYMDDFAAREESLRQERIAAQRVARGDS